MYGKNKYNKDKRKLKLVRLKGKVCITKIESFQEFAQNLDGNHRKRIDANEPCSEDNEM